MAGTDLDGKQVRIRPARPDDIPAMARVHVDTWRTTYRGILSDDFLAGLRYESREAMWRRILTDPELAARHAVYVAQDPVAGVVGIASGGPPQNRDDEFDGEIHVLYVLEAAQRRGIGRRLTNALAAEFEGRGVRSVGLWVLAENPSRGFYEAMGGLLFRSKTVEFGGEMVEEVSYRWADVADLVAASSRAD